VVLPKSPIGEAVGYARGQREALKRYITDGDLSIDDHLSERALRRVCVGRNPSSPEASSCPRECTRTVGVHSQDVWQPL